jgi:hypothetical protein
MTLTLTLTLPLTLTLTPTLTLTLTLTHSPMDWDGFHMRICFKVNVQVSYGQGFTKGIHAHPCKGKQPSSPCDSDRGRVQCVRHNCSNVGTTTKEQTLLWMKCQCRCLGGAC